MLDGLGVGAGGAGLLGPDHLLLEAGLDAAHVGRNVGQAVGVRPSVSADDVNVLGGGPLDATDVIGVAGQLHEGRHPHAPGELGVDHLVAPRPPGAGAPDADQEVSVAPPAPVEERSLVDGGCAGGHGLGRGCLRGRQLLQGVPGTGELDDVSVPGARPARAAQTDQAADAVQRLEVSPLVLVAQTGQELELRIPPRGPLQLAPRHRQLQADQLGAGQEGGEVGGAADEAVAGQVHGSQFEPRV